ncbi:hypothetical protein ABZ606_07395 [Streptomyces sp. NPDC012461]|uniref:hypothetical protein n=1 Tax=unclassified Streptomyces TaxID=2593676 RepID=UPI0019423A6B|nr:MULTISPECIES: hypothetical protein [unclassified Streptomyces]MBM7090817.1 hypothetical protein [Streptomyces sp. S12]
MLGGLLDLLLDRDGRVQQVYVPELETEQLAGAEPGGSAEQHETLVAGRYLLGQRPYLFDGQGHDLLPWYRGQFRLGAGVMRDHPVTNGRPEDGVDRVEDRP